MTTKKELEKELLKRIEKYTEHGDLVLYPRGDVITGTEIEILNEHKYGILSIHFDDIGNRLRVFLYKKESD